MLRKAEAAQREGKREREVNKRGLATYPPLLCSTMRSGEGANFCWRISTTTSTSTTSHPNNIPNNATKPCPSIRHSEHALKIKLCKKHPDVQVYLLPCLWASSVPVPTAVLSRIAAFSSPAVVSTVGQYKWQFLIQQTPHALPRSCPRDSRLQSPRMHMHCVMEGPINTKWINWCSIQSWTSAAVRWLWQTAASVGPHMLNPLYFVLKVSFCAKRSEI